MRKLLFLIPVLLFGVLGFIFAHDWILDHYIIIKRVEGEYWLKHKNWCTTDTPWKSDIYFSFDENFEINASGGCAVLTDNDKIWHEIIDESLDVLRYLDRIKSEASPALKNN